jgi:anti-sigma factor RsiW
MRRDCRRTPDLLERRREGRLGARDESALTAHLATCPACRDEAAEGAPLPLFAGLTSAPLPAALAADILRAVRVGMDDAVAPSPRPWGWLRPAPALAPLALAAGLVLLWAFGGGPAPLPAAEPPLAAHAMSNTVGTVEDIRSDTANVYAFSVTGPGGPTEVILIVDRSIDL